jgi:hypothetical protein
MGMSWEDVERHYKQALEAFEELEKSKAICVLGLPVSQAKQAFIDRWSFSVEHHAGDPKRILKEMVKHAANVILDCAERSAEKIALQDTLKKLNKSCIVTWNWNPAKKKCYIYKQYAPEAKPVKDEIECPSEEEDGLEAAMKAKSYIAEKLTHCLLVERTALGTRLIDPKRYYEDPIGLSLDELVKKIIEPLKEVWERKREEVEQQS